MTAASNLIRPDLKGTECADCVRYSAPAVDRAGNAGRIIADYEKSSLSESLVQAAEPNQVERACDSDAMITTRIQKQDVSAGKFGMIYLLKMDCRCNQYADVSRRGCTGDISRSSGQTR